MIRILLFAGCLLGLCFGGALQAAQLAYQGHALDGNTVTVSTERGAVALRFLDPGVVEVLYRIDGLEQPPSRTLYDAEPAPVAVDINASADALRLSTDLLAVVIEKSPLRISYFRGQEHLLSEQSGFFVQPTLRGFRFELGDDEKLLGTGQRVLGMDRRGHRLPLDNKPHYGYGEESKQMYFSIPGVLSSRNYMLIFDNAARGTVDLGADEPDVLQFHAVAGRTAYVVVAGQTYQDTLTRYLRASGMPPMPPRWALGNYSSRYGYRNEAEARAVVDLHLEQGFPLDVIVIDLYWFGPDEKGHMGNLAWDRDNWPDPEGMMADFRDKGVQTILVTEPFILTTSNRWQEAVDADVLALNMAGYPRTFDFHFGNSGLLDVFKPETAEWFWQICRGLMAEGVAGWWGDLGEPEVHRRDTLHRAGMSDEIHNVYGHTWAEGLYQRHVRDFPERRPFIMMRAGAPGSQRYGMIPWTGDVERSWAGLRPQVELALQMSLFGFGYIHSDLGGFAEGEVFDAELYTRWMQFGVFQPVYRPHAQDHIPSEPVFHDERTRNIVRDYVHWRYRLMAYNYTLAYQHSRTGLPLMRPLFYLEPDNPDLIDEANSYLWGDAFLVAPVTEPGVDRWSVNLPRGVWFDYFSGRRHSGGRVIEVPVTLETIPVMVRAGSFVPKVDVVQSTRDYSSEKLELHYWHDSSVSRAQGLMFEDDGHSRTSLNDGAFELLHFDAEYDEGGLRLDLRREGAYSGMPEQRDLVVVIHKPPTVHEVRVNGSVVPVQPRSAEIETAAWLDETGHLKVKLPWSSSNVNIEVRGESSST